MEVPQRRRVDRVAIVMSHASRSMDGAVRDLLLARALRARDVEAAVFRMHHGAEVEREELHGAPVIFCPADDATIHVRRQVSAALREAVLAFRPDAVLYKGLSYAVNADLQSCLPEGTPLGLVVGGEVQDPLLPRAAVVLGEYQQQVARHFADHQRGGRAMVLPKWVDLALAGPGTPPAEPEFDIVNVGNFHEVRKNQGDLLPLTDRHRIAFVGAGPLQAPMRRAVARRAYAHFLGRLPRAEVYGVLRRAAVMVHTSRMEGLPRAVVEAMACGLPVIGYRATLDGAVPNGTGLLVTPGALRHAVDLLLTDAGLRVRMGQSARRHAERHHGEAAIDAAAIKLLGILRT